MGNLNELHVPPNADEAADFAARREYGLRWDAYHEALAWEKGVIEAMSLFRCVNPEQAWIDMLSDSGHSVKA